MDHDSAFAGGEAMLRSIGRAGGRDLMTEALGLGLDKTLDASLLRDLPIIGWAAKSADVTLAIRDRLFAQKLMGFVAGTSSSSEAAIEKFVDGLSDPKQRRRAGETLLSLIERHEHIKKSFVLGRLLAARIDGQIDGARFMELAAALDRATVEELRRVKRLHNKEVIDDLDAMWNLARTGLVTVQFSQMDEYVVLGHFVNALGDDMVRHGLSDLNVDPPAGEDFP